MPVVAGVVVAVVAIIAVALVSLDGSGSEWPDEVAGLARVESAETRAFEEGFGEIEFGDLEISFGFYGRADQVELMLARYANLPPGAPLEGLLQGAGGGIIGSGGSAEIDAASVTERDGINYHCMPFQGSSSSPTRPRPMVRCASGTRVPTRSCSWTPPRTTSRRRSTTPPRRTSRSAVDLLPEEPSDQQHRDGDDQALRRQREPPPLRGPRTGRSPSVGEPPSR
jgi:hypothetical protein